MTASEIAAKAKKASKPSATDQQQIVDTAKKVADILQANGAEVMPEPEEMHHS
jgi:glycine/serine hydroxymethyltransferase